MGSANAEIASHNDVVGDNIDTDDDEVTHSQTAAASSHAAQRHARNLAFDAWLTSSAAQKALDKPTHRGKDGDESESISSILARQQMDLDIIKSPREYQMELFERAKAGNTIAVLDTGSGKTLIAVLLLRWTIEKENEKISPESQRKTAFFLVPSVSLVFQQYSVLECNLDIPIARLCGAEGVDTWSSDAWDRLFADKRAIVCTPDILLHCLGRSYITMKQINLLIFDEAHHAKKDHPYARILRDFYMDEEQPQRPRVFGMTASPFDVKENPVQAMTELESIMHSRIATTSDMSLSAAVKKPQEYCLGYAACPQSMRKTKFLQALEQRFAHIEIFATPFRRAADVAGSLGRWCADTYLLHVFSRVQLPKYERKLESVHHTQTKTDEVTALDHAIAELREAIEWVECQAVLRPQILVAGDVSPKVVELSRYLAKHFDHETDHRCIVFVEERYTARLLHNFFTSIKSTHSEYMRCGFLIGSRAVNLTEQLFSFRQQVLTLTKFRKGEINCLFATSVAEEGLDVPTCNLVIRFDICQTVIKYIQSRGRARDQDSKFTHMVEMGNIVHAHLLREVHRLETSMKTFCQSLPQDRYLIGNQDETEALLEKEKNLRTYTEPSSGAKLTYGNALAFLASFVSSLPSSSHEMQRPCFMISNRGQKFVAEVILPENAPLHSVVGLVRSRKSLAKRSAAFQACLRLRQKGFLDERFHSTYHKKLPAMRNALLAINSDKKSQYLNRVKPSIWAQDRGKMPSELWMTSFDFQRDLGRPHRPLILLTRTPMPAFPDFPVFPDDGRQTIVVSSPQATSITVTAAMVDSFAAFTFRVLRDIFSKTYEQNTAKLSYWLCPVVFLPRDMQDNIADCIDWRLLDEVSVVSEYKWTPCFSNILLEDKFLVDPYDGSRKFYSKSINPSLKQTDPVPPGTAKSKWHGTILDYSSSLWKKARELKQWSPNQPVLEAELLRTRRNLLAPPVPKESNQETWAVLCPEPFHISVLPTDVVATAVMFPAIIHRIESYLIALEGCQAVGLESDLQLSLVLAAFTKDSDNSGEHGNEERINFQSGMGENYERLEFIGDTFLKMATTISTFIANPDENEFEFHVRRMLMLCNKNLFRVAQDLKLYEYIRCTSFSRRLWYPEGIRLIGGKGAKKEDDPGDSFHDVQKQPLGEKTVADVCEALIGAAFLSRNKLNSWNAQDWHQAIVAVTKLVDSDDHRMLAWNDYRLAYKKPAYQTATATATQRHLAQEVKTKRHNYSFQHPRLLYSAFLHPSMGFMTERMPNYQRLEFLGDALLDMACVTYLFYRYPSADPQWLTEHKMAMVSNKFLGAVCVVLGFHHHLRHADASLNAAISAYVTELLEARAAASPLARDFWTTVADPPKCLADMVEAYIGALFIDSDFNYAEVLRFFEEHIRWFFEDMTIYDTFASNHPCTRLQQILEVTFGCANHGVILREVPAAGAAIDATEVVAGVVVHNEVIAYCKGQSGRYARIRVAGRALDVLEGLAPSEFRRRFGCACKAKDDIGTTGSRGPQAE